MPPKDIILCQKCRSTFRVHDHVLPSSLVTDLRDGIQISADVHAESIRRTLDGLQPKLCEYDAEIEALEETLVYLKKCRADVAHSISVYKTYLAPIRRLPLELLREIFLEACSSTFLAVPEREILQTASQTPLNIASVCSYWRDICLAFPHLWTSIFVNADNAKLTEQEKNLVSLFQRRSLSRPTHISISADFLITYQDSAPDDDPHYDNPIVPYTSLKTVFSPMSPILDLSSCRSLMLTMGLARQSDLDLPSPHFALLERLYLKGWFNANNEMALNFSSHMFSDTPRLRELHLHDSGCLTDFNLPWSRIRTLWLELYSGTWDQIVDIIDRFPLLDTLVFYGGRFTDPTTNVIRDGIKGLQIWGEPGINVAIFSILRLPDLHRLELLDDELGPAYDITPEDVDNMLPFLLSSPSLTELRFEKAILNDSDLLRILESVPKLVSLSIIESNRTPQHSSITGQLLERMMETDCFLPKLEHLELVWAENIEVDEGKVMDVIESRREVVKFVSVGVRDGGELSRETLQRIQTLRRCGLHVRLY